MIRNIPRAVRLMLAAMLTLFLMPFLGFGLYGLMASREPGANNLVFLIGYIIFLFALLVVVCLLWGIALRTWRCDLPTVCKRCGYDLRGKTTGPCPECGRGPVARKAS